MMKVISKKGLILITTLWLFVLLTILTLSIGRRLRLQKNIIQQRYLLLQSQLIAHSFVNHIIYKLNSGNLKFDNPTDLEENLKLPDYHQPILLDTFQAGIFHKTGKQYKKGIYSGNSKININYIPAIFKNNIFESSLIDQDQLSYILDWIDKDNDPYNNGDGAEKDYYQDLPFNYEIFNSPILSPQTYWLIRGMRKETFDILQKNFTIYGDGKVNINTANLQTLTWLGLSESTQIKINDFLIGPDLISNSEDDTKFESEQTILKQLEEATELSADEKTEIQKCIPFLKTNPDYYQFYLTPYVNSKVTSYNYQVLLLKQDQNWTVKEFKNVLITKK